jgi:hypothetical protein
MASRNSVNFLQWLHIDEKSAESSTLPPSVLQIVDDMRGWIEAYISRNLHPGASTWEFRESFRCRLEKKIQPSASQLEIRKAVKRIVRDLVHDQNRTYYRRNRRLKPDVAIDQYADPRSGSFEQKLLVQSQAEAILRQVSEKHRGLVEQIYGLRNIEKVPRDVMAQRLGIPRNTLDQKLRRILRRVNKLLAQ